MFPSIRSLPSKLASILPFNTIKLGVRWPASRSSNRSDKEILALAVAFGESDVDLDEVLGADGPLSQLASSRAGVRGANAKESAEIERGVLRAKQEEGSEVDRQEGRRREQLAQREEALHGEQEEAELEAKQAHDGRAQLSLLRRSFGAATDVHLSIIGVVATADITLIGLAQQILPGKDAQHWISAAAIGAVLAGFGHVVGDVSAGLMERLRAKAISTQIAVAAGVLLGAGAIIMALGLRSMTAFRDLGLIEQSRDKIPDPTYLGWVQAIAVYAASVSAAIWRVGEEGRDALQVEKRHLTVALNLGLELTSVRNAIQVSFGRVDAVQLNATAAGATMATIDDRLASRIAAEQASADYIAAMAESVAKVTRSKKEQERGASAQQRIIDLLAVTGVALLSAAVGYLLVDLGQSLSALSGVLAGGLAYRILTRPAEDGDVAPGSPGAMQQLLQDIPANGHNDPKKVKP